MPDPTPRPAPLPDAAVAALRDTLVQCDRQHDQGVPPPIVLRLLHQVYAAADGYEEATPEAEVREEAWDRALAWYDVDLDLP